MAGMLLQTIYYDNSQVHGLSQPIYEIFLINYRKKTEISKEQKISLNFLFWTDKNKEIIRSGF